MPVASGRMGGSRQLLVLAFATIAGLGAMLFLISQAPQLAGSDRIDVQLGDEVFEAGKAEDTADFIADQGPWLMPDLIEGRDRDIILQHIGDDPETGWHAFAARPLDASRDCFLQWRPEDDTFVDTCDGTVYDETGNDTTGPEGNDLTRYPVSLDADGNLTVDINAADREADTDADSEGD